ncbi:DUF397 domain-containing protein [Streptomyces swartbergensis]|uniref:DUF397 domain-containing protein n=1 Tax=Streptomyces swartbergensis TaxID=487165 RepID=A0A243S2U7_9ACTN|nr:DUF397 domain-containing protein [Streptomyces swartbergensis]OUD01857.1 DUF397 domain-containing protein [Streptomyces swartbergensis]
MTPKPNWRTSSYTSNDSCVEVADNDLEVVRVRDTKDREQGLMALRPASWAHFVKFTKQLPL